MLRVAIGVSVLGLLVGTYLVNPVVGWFGQGTVLLLLVLVRRSRQSPARVADVRNALRALK